jgi:hypothetical protein
MVLEVVQAILLCELQDSMSSFTDSFQPEDVLYFWIHLTATVAEYP